MNWGGDYASNYQDFTYIPGPGITYQTETGLDFDGIGVDNDRRFGREFSTTTPLSPGSGYNTALDSAVFYGGFVINQFNPSGSAGFELQPNSAGVFGSPADDRILFRTQSTGTSAPHTFAFVTYWDKAGFLNGFNTAPVSLSDVRNISISTCANCNVPEGAHLHFVVRDGSQFYVSQAYWGGSDLSDPDRLGVFPDGDVVNFNPNTAGLGWKAYDPSGLDIQFEHGGYIFPTFNDITAIGFYIDTLEPVTNATTIVIDGFSVVLIPEPSSAIGLLFLLTGALSLRRRRLLPGS